MLCDPLVQLNGLSVRYLWNVNSVVIFALQRNKDASKVLAVQDTEKKDKNLQSCHAMRKDFTPLLYTVDGIAVREANSVEKHLPLRRSGINHTEKWSTTST